jgi:hypothetical protein
MTVENTTETYKHHPLWPEAKMPVKNSGSHATVDHRDQCALHAFELGMPQEEVHKLLLSADWIMQMQSIAPLLNKARRDRSGVSQRVHNTKPASNLLAPDFVGEDTISALVTALKPIFEDAQKWRKLQNMMEK